MANLNLFSVCVAKKTKVPALNISELLKDKSNQGFRAIYGRASLPMNLCEACEMLLNTIRDFEIVSSKNTGSLRLSGEDANRLIERLLMTAEEAGKPDNISYLLSLIKHASEGGK